MSLLQNSNAISTGGAYNLTDSVRFRSSASAYLNWTPATAGNRKTWTWSAWVKRGNLGSVQRIFNGLSGSDDDFIRFDSNNTVQIWLNSGVGALTTTQIFRDTSAWYHIVYTVDTTQATSSNRLKLYINGIQVTAFSTATYPAQNTDGAINNNVAHYFGRYPLSNVELFDGYMTEVNFVDGQQLTASDFGETDTVTGVWKPKEYEGTYGTNGFYLPMKETTQAEGFNTVLYTGTGASQSITGVGFSPDLVWMKRRTTDDHDLQDSVRGGGKSLISNSTAAEANLSGSYGISSFDANGFSLISNGGRTNESGGSYVAWCWDAGSGSPVTNAAGTNGATIESTYKANPATGFSVVTYTGNATAGATIGHGLGVAPNVVILKNRDSSAHPWVVYHSSNTSAPETDYLVLNTTAATVDSDLIWNDTAPTSSVFTVGSAVTSNGSGNKMIGYCFAEVAGYQKIGSYTGTGAAGNTVTTGFRPAFLLIKRTDASASWHIIDATRNVDDPRNSYLQPSSNAAENIAATLTFDYTDTGFTVNGTGGGNNASGGTYLYLAIADTRDAQFNFDASGNKNNWTANNINSNASSETTYDIMKDVPTLTDEDTANFATMNPLVRTSGTLTISDGNLTNTYVSAWNIGLGTIALPTSGKFYWESTQTSGANLMFGVYNPIQNTEAASAYTHTGGAIFYFSNGNKYINGAASAYGSTFITGDTIGVAVNLDANTITFYKNNVSQGAISFAANMIGIPLSPAFLGISSASVVNFGQRPFAYTPPTGFKKLNTYNLPDSSIVDGSKNFDVALDTGANIKTASEALYTSQLAWIKDRINVNNHQLIDSVRGLTAVVQSNTTAAETTYSAPSGSSVAWNWKAGGTAVSIAAGSIDGTNPTIASSVSANPTAGFSVVTYTGVNATSTIGHGLGVAPKFIITKLRNVADGWYCYHEAIGNNKFIRLDTISTPTTSTIFGNTSPTSTVFTNQVGNYTCVAYCFADVEGYSKFGSYTGNANVNGPFVYTGFRPAFIMVRAYSLVGKWFIMDATRDPNNVATARLMADLTNAEDNSGIVDFTANGFKLRMASALNDAADYIYMAFAENPFKNSLAR
jgi:hypothetical protein